DDAQAEADHYVVENLVIPKMVDLLKSHGRKVDVEGATTGRIGNESNFVSAIYVAEHQWANFAKMLELPVGELEIINVDRVVLWIDANFCFPEQSGNGHDVG